MSRVVSYTIRSNSITMPFGDVYYAQGKAEISRNTGTKFSADTEKDTNVWL